MDLETDWLSPFSSNPSTLALETENSEITADRNTLFEMEVLEILRSTINRYIERYYEEGGNPSCGDPDSILADLGENGIPENYQQNCNSNLQDSTNINGGDFND